VAPRCWQATPPPTARLGSAAVNSRASRVITSSSTPLASATFLAVKRARNPRARSASTPASRDRPCRTTLAAIPSATSPSVPGRGAIHSSALYAVSPRRGSTATNFAIAPSRYAWASAKPWVYSTGEIHVSRKSAPKERMYLAAAKSGCGSDATPKVSRLASRSGS
jgi:hypothetical protein